MEYYNLDGRLSYSKLLVSREYASMGKREHVRRGEEK